MPNYFYYNASGNKIGPVTVAEIKALAQQRIITQETVVENEEGRAVVAGKIKGLAFPESAAPLTEPNPFTDAAPVAANPFTVPVSKNQQAMPQVVPSDLESSSYGLDGLTLTNISHRILLIIALIVVVPLIIGGLCIGSCSGGRGTSASASPISIATKFIEYVIANEDEILDLANGWTENDVVRFRGEISWGIKTGLSDLRGNTYEKKIEFENTHNLNDYLFGFDTFPLRPYANGESLSRSIIARVHREKFHELLSLAIAEVKRNGGRSSMF